MSSLLDLVTGTLDSSTIQQLGSRIGASPEQTGAAVNAAVPLLLGALHQNSNSATGALALLGALDRHPDALQSAPFEMYFDPATDENVVGTPGVVAQNSWTNGPTPVVV